MKQLSKTQINKIKEAMFEYYLSEYKSRFALYECYDLVIEYVYSYLTDVLDLTEKELVKYSYDYGLFYCTHYHYRERCYQTSVNNSYSGDNISAGIVHLSHQSDIALTNRTLRSLTS